jgi:hypothetical protein
MAVPCFEHFIIFKYNITCIEMPWNPINAYSFYVFKKRTERENSNILVEKKIQISWIKKGVATFCLHYKTGNQHANHVSETTKEFLPFSEGFGPGELPTGRPSLSEEILCCICSIRSHENWK